MIPRASLRLATVGVLLAALAGTFAATAPAIAASQPAVTSAYGIQMLDADGGTLQSPAPLSEWSSGATVDGSLASVGDVMRLNTTQASGLTSRAASDGARAEVSSGTFQLRDRVPVAFTGLTVTCGTDGSSSVSFDSLTVNGTDILDTAKLSAGYTYNLPNSATWGSTRLFIGERSTVSGRLQVTGLRIEGEAGWSEIWRIRLGTASCMPSRAAVTGSLVTGVSVTAANGTPVIPGAPRLTSSGSTKADDIRSLDTIDLANDVAISHSDDGSSRVTIGSFTQIPDTSSIGLYTWSAFRVYGMTLTVAADGSSTLAFDRSYQAIFTNGVWVNTGTDLYTGLDSSGTPRVRVHLNERVTHSDGSITITAARYEDLTGAYPTVSLGTVHWSPSASSGGSGSSAQPTPAVTLPGRYAFAVDAQGPSAIDPSALSITPGADGADRFPGATSSAASSTVTDGASGQISVADAATESTASRSTVSLGSVTLYPGSSMEVALTDVRLTVDATGATLTTGGGTVAGTTIAAGTVAANTRIALSGRSATLTLNAQSGDASRRTVVAVDVDDSRGLGAHVRAGVVTADPLAVVVTPGGGGSSGSAGNGTGGQGSGSGSGSSQEYSSTPVTSGRTSQSGRSESAGGSGSAGQGTPTPTPSASSAPRTTTGMSGVAIGQDPDSTLPSDDAAADAATSMAPASTVDLSGPVGMSATAAIGLLVGAAGATTVTRIRARRRSA